MGFLMTLKRAFSKSSSIPANSHISSSNQSQSQAGWGGPMGHNHEPVESSSNPEGVVGPPMNQQPPDEASMDPAAVEPQVQIVSVVPPLRIHPITVGPFGGVGGCEFDDGIYNTVKQVVVTWGLAIDNIRIEYDQNGLSVWTEHGGPGGSNTSRIILDYPNEFLISVWGSYGKLSDYLIVRSLTFQSNRRTYGPFGRPEEGRYFSFPPTGGKIVGFHGRSGLCLDSIGAYLQ